MQRTGFQEWQARVRRSGQNRGICACTGDCAGFLCRRITCNQEREERMKNLLRKKKKGEITEFIAVTIFLFLTAVIWQVFLFNQRTVNAKDEIDTVMNHYILCMETDGYLTDANRAALIGDLQNAGMKDIDLTGTDFSSSARLYGERVTLQINGKIEIPVFQIEWLRLTRGTRDVNITEKRVSISHGLG